MDNSTYIKTYKYKRAEQSESSRPRYAHKYKYRHEVAHAGTCTPTMKRRQEIAQILASTGAVADTRA
eukprot:2749521-Pleurochrysis_carterae.AAC.1